MRRAALVLVALVSFPVSHAQSVYLDFGPPGSPAGIAPAAYAGPAVAPGHWNGVGSAAASGLLAADGGATAVSLTIDYAPFGPVFGVADVGSVEHAAMLDDFLHGDSIFGFLDFAGLAAGEYLVHTVDVEMLVAFPVTIGVVGSADPEQALDGVWAGSFVPGAVPSMLAAGNYSRHWKEVEDGSLRITIGAFGRGDPPHVRGVQVVRVDEHAAPFCFGDGSAGAPCPCANDGAPGRGCASSAAGSGARLYGTGSPSAPTNPLGLHAEDLPASALAIFLQGNAGIAPIAFGDGLRCAGGNLKRLYVKNASAGLVHAPESGDPSVSARSAELGDPIPVGERRYYQIYYRDPDAGFCPPPAGSTFNATNALEVVW